MSYGPSQLNHYGGPPPSHSPQPPFHQGPPGPYPPQNQGWGQPPQGHSPYPQATQGYGPPPNQAYPPPQQFPQQGQWNQGPYNQGPPSGPYNQGPYNQGPPPPQNYPPQQQQFPVQPPFSTGPPEQPSPGYVPGQMAHGDAGADATALRNAMKGVVTNESVLIRILSKPDPLQMALLRHTYDQRLGRNLEKDIKSKTGGHFEEALLALVRGPLTTDVHNLNNALRGLGTKESMLNDVLLGRSNADIIAIKHAYREKFRDELEAHVRGDLSGKTELHFDMVLEANRAPESAPVYPQAIDEDVTKLYQATEGKVGTEQLTVCRILSTRSDSQIRAIAYAFERKYHITLEKVIEKEFWGHMQDALLMQLRGGTDRAMRDAMLLEDTMKGIGTKDSLLVQRIVRLHWNPAHMDQVKRAYKHRYRRDLASRVKGEVSGKVEKILLALLA